MTTVSTGLDRKVAQLDDFHRCTDRDDGQLDVSAQFASAEIRPGRHLYTDENGIAVTDRDLSVDFDDDLRRAFKTPSDHSPPRVGVKRKKPTETGGLPFHLIDIASVSHDSVDAGGAADLVADHQQRITCG